MKKLIFILMTVFFVFAITGCPPDDEDEKHPTKTFWAQDMKTKNFYQLNAEKLAENSRCIVWAEEGSGVTSSTANDVAAAYNTVYAKMMNTFGWTLDIDPEYGGMLCK